MSMYLVRVPFSLCAVLLQDRLTPSPPPRRPPLPFQYNLYMPSWAIGECIHSPISIHRQRFCKHCTPPWTIIGLKMDSILLAFINSNISSSESNKIPNPPPIPHICHERHEYIRLNFFWPVQIFTDLMRKLAFSTDFTRKIGVFYRFNAKNWRFSV